MPKDNLKQTLKFDVVQWQFYTKIFFRKTSSIPLSSNITVGLQSEEFYHKKNRINFDLKDLFWDWACIFSIKSMKLLNSWLFGVSSNPGAFGPAALSSGTPVPHKAPGQQVLYLLVQVSLTLVTRHICASTSFHTSVTQLCKRLSSAGDANPSVVRRLLYDHVPHVLSRATVVL